MNSGMLLAGTDGFTTMTFGKRTMAATGAMSRMKLKLRLSYSVALIALGAPAKTSVYPSGGERTTVSMPRLPPAPGRFSMMKVWLSLSDKYWPIRRATMSVAPADPKGPQYSLEIEQPGGRTDQHGQFVLAVDQSQNNPDDLFELAQSAKEAGDIDEAERLYRILMKCDPTDASAPFNLGNMLRADGRNVEAE